jgi:hypothetical protein
MSEGGGVGATVGNVARVTGRGVIVSVAPNMC